MASKVGRSAPRVFKKGARPKIELPKRLNIFVGDTVQVVDGRYDLGKQGKVLRILPEKQLVTVQGVREVRCVVVFPQRFVNIDVYIFVLPTTRVCVLV